MFTKGGFGPARNQGEHRLDAIYIVPQVEDHLAKLRIGASLIDDSMELFVNGSNFAEFLLIDDLSHPVNVLLKPLKVTVGQVLHSMQRGKSLKFGSNDEVLFQFWIVDWGNASTHVGNMGHQPLTAQLANGLPNGDFADPKMLGQPAYDQPLIWFEVPFDNTLFELIINKLVFRYECYIAIPLCFRHDDVSDRPLN